MLLFNYVLLMSRKLLFAVTTLYKAYLGSYTNNPQTCIH